jgi:hypothetical protein
MTEFDMDSFVEGVPGQKLAPPAGLRVNASCISIGIDYFEKIGFGIIPASKRFYYKIAYSSQHKAIKIDPANDGYCLYIKKGVLRGGNLPTILKTMKAPKGIYLQDAENPNIFVYEDLPELEQSESNFKPLGKGK